MEHLLTVLLRRPAIVKLARPFLVEPLPAQALSYCEDLRFSTAPLRLPFDSPPETVFSLRDKEP